MPALLKCDVGTFAPDAILDVYLTVHLAVDFGPRFWSSSVRVFAGISVFSVFGAAARAPF
jgi:hypothetical protein